MLLVISSNHPNVIYNIQSNAAGIPFKSPGATAPILYTYLGASTTNPTGNTNTGISNLVLDAGNIAALNVGLKILRFVPVDGNVPLVEIMA